MHFAHLVSRRAVKYALVVCLGVLGLVGVAKAAESESVDDLEQKAFKAAAERVAQSVLRIETLGGLERVSNVLMSTGPTTGLVIDKDGYIISSAFNFANKPSSILVRLPDGTRKAADLVATDHNRMLALLKVQVDKPLPVAEIAPEKEMRVGQWAIAVGRTFDSEKPNITVGVVSALNRIWGKAIQTDAIISPNNYGGPLLDIRGRVMGVLVPLAADAATEVAGVEWYDSGIGFAIPAEYIQSILPRLKKGADLLPGVIGINVDKNLQTGDSKISAVQPNSPAGAAGFKKDDKIVEINGKPISRAAEVKREIAKLYAGDTMKIVVTRGKERIEKELTLVDKLTPFEHAFLGVLPMRAPTGEGVAIRHVLGSAALKAGLKPGDVIKASAGKAVAGPNELREDIGSRKPDEEVELDVVQGDKTNKVKIKLATLPDGLPPESLPASHGAVTAEGQRPSVGMIAVSVPELKNEAPAYVPEVYNKNVPHGLVIWIHGDGGFDQDKFYEQVKPLCDEHEIIFVTPKANDPAKWALTEVAFIQKVVEQLKSTYTIDPSRVVIFGHEAGGPVAWSAAAQMADDVRAVVALDAPITAKPPTIDPLHRFAVMMITAQKSSKTKQIEQSLSGLRNARVPVTVKPIGEDPRMLNDEEMAQVFRWIDTLDRI